MYWFQSSQVGQLQEALEAKIENNCDPALAPTRPLGKGRRDRERPNLLKLRRDLSFVLANGSPVRNGDGKVTLVMAQALIALA